MCYQSDWYCSIVDFADSNVDIGKNWANNKRQDQQRIAPTRYIEGIVPFTVLCSLPTPEPPGIEQRAIWGLPSVYITDFTVIYRR